MMGGGGQRREVRGRRVVAVVGAALASVALLPAAGCDDGGASGAAARRTPSPAYAAPWPQRPVVALSFDVAADRRRVAGVEDVRFTPDRRVCELVFRLWPNKPETARAGNALTVGRVSVDGRPVAGRMSVAGGLPGRPGTLLEVPVKRCVEAGRTVRVRLGFTLTLGADTPERVGYDVADRVAWFASAFPLLAYERGHGWMREPAVDLIGEVAGSEEFRLERLDVVAPSGDVVAGTGAASPAVAGPRPGTTLHRFSADAVRDVAVSVGRLATVTRQVGAVRVHVTGPRGTAVPLRTWANLTAGSVRRLADLLGPYPYTDLWVTVLRDCPSGIELPGAIQFADIDPGRYPPLVSHEVAHMWFYGLVGNDQGRDPWLDESFATYAQAVADHDEERYLDPTVSASLIGRLGAPMTAWAALPDGSYSAGVYLQGGQALLRARARVGAARFDRAIRAYVATNAHRVVRPADVQEAFAGRPEVLRLLSDAGAFAADPART